MTDPVEYLDLDDIVALAERLLGRPAPIRDVGLLGSAVARPQTTIGGRDAYPDVWSKAAALIQSIVNNHALIDGNKCLGWLATAVFLDLSARLGHLQRRRVRLRDGHRRDPDQPRRDHASAARTRRWPQCQTRLA